MSTSLKTKILNQKFLTNIRSNRLGTSTIIDLIDKPELINPPITSNVGVFDSKNFRLFTSDKLRLRIK